MEEGQIKFQRLGADLYSVRSDANSTGLDFVGMVRSAAEGVRGQRVWFARHAGSKDEIGPLPTRKAAAAKLI